MQTSGNLYPCIPEAFKTALIIGQDFYSISNYSAVMKHHVFGTMSYTALRSSSSGSLGGLRDPINYGSGIEWAEGQLENYDDSILQLGLWLVNQLDDVNSGVLNEEIKGLAEYVKEVSPQKVYIRIGYEFDSIENRYDPKAYTDAFRKIVDTFRGMDVANAAFVWHSATSEKLSQKEVSFTSWYPGEGYVDWCGVSLFQQPYECYLFQDASNCKMKEADDFAYFCRSKDIPVMIAESTPFGGIVDYSVILNNPGVVNRAGFPGDTWSAWFLPVLAYINRHDVRMWSYINCNWDAQPMWQQNHAPGIYWGDSRIEAHPWLRDQWRAYVLNSPRFSWSVDNTYSEADRAQICKPASGVAIRAARAIASYILAMLVFLCIGFTVAYFLYADVFLPLWHRLTRRDYGPQSHGGGSKMYGGTTSSSSHAHAGGHSYAGSSSSGQQQQLPNITSQDLYGFLSSYHSEDVRDSAAAHGPRRGSQPGSRLSSNPSSRVPSRMSSRTPSRRTSFNSADLYVAPHQEYGTHLKTPIDIRKVNF